MRTMFSTVVFALGSALLLSTPRVLAQEAPPAEESLALETTDDTTSWTLRGGAMLWRPALLGDVVLPGGTASTEIEDLRLDDNELTFGADASIRGDKWTFSLSGFSFSTDVSAPAFTSISPGGLAIGAGSTFSAEADLTSVQATAAYTLWSTALQGETSDRNVQIRFDALAGIRACDADLRVRTGSSTASGSDTWFEPIVGATLEAVIWEEFAIELAGDLGFFPQGSGGSSSSWNVTAGARWSPNPNMEARLGFRFLSNSFDNGDDFEWNATLGGLFVGVSLWF